MVYTSNSVEFHSAHYRASTKILGQIRAFQKMIDENGVEKYAGKKMAVDIGGGELVYFDPDVIKQKDAETIYHNILAIEQKELDDLIKEKGRDARH